MPAIKILHLCNKVPFPGRDGSTIAMESLIRLEAQCGHHVHVVALNTDKHRIESPEVPSILQSNVKLDFFNIDVKPTPQSLLRNWGQKSSFFASRFRNMNVENHLRALLEKQSFDVVVYDGLYMAVYFPVLKKIPGILRAHNVESRIWLRQSEVMKNGAKQVFIQRHAKKLRKWEHEVVTEMKGVWAISNDDLNHLSQYNDNCSVIPCTFNPDMQWAYSGAESNRAYHLGAMDWAPNILGMKWLFEEVWPRIGQEVSFTVLSKTRPIEFQSLPEGVNWITERIPEERFSDYGILVAPLLSGSGMRIKILEAMSRGKAVLTTTIGAEGLGVTGGKHLHIEDEPVKFAEALIELNKNKSYREKLSENARQFSISQFADTSYLGQLSENLKEWLG